MKTIRTRVGKHSVNIVADEHKKHKHYHAEITTDSDVITYTEITNGKTSKKVHGILPWNNPKSRHGFKLEKLIEYDVNLQGFIARAINLVIGKGD